MQAVLDNKVYAQLLAETLPRRIKTEEENDGYLRIVEDLIDKGSENFSNEEESLFELLTVLIKDFEERNYPMQNVAPNERLKYILEERGMRQKDLVPVLGSESVASEIIRGKREITLKTAKNLAEFLGLSSYEILI